MNANDIEEIHALVNKSVDDQIGLDSAEATVSEYGSTCSIIVNLKKDHPWRKVREEAFKSSIEAMRNEMVDTSDQLIEELDLAGWGNWEASVLNDMYFTLVLTKV